MMKLYTLYALQVKDEFWRPKRDGLIKYSGFHCLWLLTKFLEPWMGSGKFSAGDVTPAYLAGDYFELLVQDKSVACKADS